MEQRLPSDDTALEAGIQEIIAQINSLHATMVSDQEKIERLKAETAQLKVEGDALKAETRAVLATLLRP